MKFRTLLAAIVLAAGFAAVQPAAAETYTGNYVNLGGRATQCDATLTAPPTCINGYRFDGLPAGTFRLDIFDEAAAVHGLPIPSLAYSGSLTENPTATTTRLCGSGNIPHIGGNLFVFFGGEAPASCALQPTPTAGAVATIGQVQLSR